MIMELLTAKQARQLAENGINKIFVQNNVDYILDIIKKKQTKENSTHTYLNPNYREK